jgi:hypothetical protein
MIIHLIIPKQRLIPITPEEVLGPNILIRVLDSLLQRRQMLPMLPMLVPEVLGVDGAEDQAGDDDAGGMVSGCSHTAGRRLRERVGAGILDRQLPPQPGCSSGMSFDSSSFAVEGVVGRASEFLAG